ncbi:MAG: mechanosensitive ion channel family protein [Nitrospira sp.]|nr:mechanosensitive ion channel family protein [Nitrospira sp.]
MQHLNSKEGEKAAMGHSLGKYGIVAILIVAGLCGAWWNQPAWSADSTVPALSQAPALQPNGAPVIFEQETLFSLYDTIGPFTPEERARAVTERLARLSNDASANARPIMASDRESTSELIHGDMILMTITDRDAQPTGKLRQDLAKEYAQKVQDSVHRVRERMSWKALLTDTGLVILATVILIAALFALHKLFLKIYAKIKSWCGPVIHPIKIQNVELLSPHQIAAGLIAVARGIRVLATLVLLYIYLTTALGIFAWTRGIATMLLEVVLSTLQTIGLAFSSYLPNIVSIVVITLVTRYILKLIGFFFKGIGRGAITFSGFHPDWAEPTYKIVRFLVIIFAAIAIFPHIPGSESEGFRGISVFLGLLISLGSAAAIGNVIAGVVLTYMRPFRVGDRVKIADTVGDVIERTLLVTRIRTIKNVDITIPNAMVGGSHIINYSSAATNPVPLILHTNVTIGYDVPWRKVHELLIDAANSTTHVLKNPPPFVLQTSLDDFYVTYELNASTDKPNSMAVIYAGIHQNIQDKFNEAGVEIMSPHFGQLRDGNQTTIPEQYLPKTYQAPSFRIGPIGNIFGLPQDAGAAKGDLKP